MIAETYLYPPSATGRGFVTGYLPDFPGDWICVTDFCGTWRGFGMHETLSVCAYWSPSRKLVAFGGQWVGTKPMPAYSEPSEEACWKWAESADTIFARKLRASRKLGDAHKARNDAITAHYRAHGYNWVTATLTQPDGSTVVVSDCVGLRGSIEVLRAACATMQQRHPKGTRITGWRFESGLTEEQVDKRRSRKDRAWEKLMNR